MLCSICCNIIFFLIKDIFITRIPFVACDFLMILKKLVGLSHSVFFNGLSTCRKSHSPNTQQVLPYPLLVKHFIDFDKYLAMPYCQLVSLICFSKNSFRQVLLSWSTTDCLFVVDYIVHDYFLYCNTKIKYFFNLIKSLNYNLIVKNGLRCNLQCNLLYNEIKTTKDHHVPYFL